MKLESKQLGTSLGVRRRVRSVPVLSWKHVTCILGLAMLLCAAVVVNRAEARGTSRPVSAAEIRRGHQDVRRQYGRYYNHYASVRYGRYYNPSKTIRIRRPGPISRY
jgi:hypothetical protein